MTQYECEHCNKTYGYLKIPPTVHKSICPYCGMPLGFKRKVESKESKAMTPTAKKVEEAVAPRKRGRPRKIVEVPKVEEIIQVAPRKRGRPKKILT